MPGCVLRVAGAALDIDSLLQTCELKPCSVWRRGERRTPRSTRIPDDSGATFDVSGASGDEVPVQIEESLAFLRSHGPQLQTLSSAEGVEHAYFDFGWDFPFERTVGQWNYFPPEFLRECAAVGLGVCVSVYAAASSPADADAR